MADETIPLSLKEFKDGLVTRLSDVSISDGAFSDVQNIDLTEKFLPKKSNGQIKYNSTTIGAAPIKGAGKYAMADGTAYYICACNGKLYYSIVESRTWTTYKIGGADLTIDDTADVEMAQYANSMWIVNGTYPIIKNTGFTNTKMIKITGTLVNNEVSGTADSGTTTTIVDSILTEANGYWNNAIVMVTAGTNAGEVRTVSDFVSATHTLTVGVAFTNAIDGTSIYSIYKYIGDANTPQGGKYPLIHMERLFLAGSTDQSNGLY